jgi:hypothetical protein
MPRTLRSRQYQMAQARQRTSQPFAHFEAPVGGWNTRDSIDNIAPTDALTLDNWWPDIGEVRTRPGYIEHCDISDLALGAELISNGGFETAGGGGADVFSDWSETTTGTGQVQDETTTVYKDSHACALIAPSGSGGTAAVDQDITVSASVTYHLDFYFYDNFSGTSTILKYSVYDNDNTAYIQAETGVTGTGSGDWLKFSLQWTAPAGCTSVNIAFKADTNAGGASLTFYIDEVSVQRIASTVGPIQTLAEYISGSNRKLVAAMSGEIFDVSTSPGSLLSAGSGTYTSDKWQWVNFDGYLVMVNGTEAVEWDGSTFQALTPAVTGPSTAPIGCNVFKNRVWYWEANSQSVWYTALNAKGGATTEFPLGRVGQFGGNLVLMETWTRDGGSGPDDFAVFVMSSGEALVYQGSSPAVGGDWALVGIYNIGEPIGYRSAVKFGGDLFILTRLDVVRMSEVISGVEARQMESKIVQAHRTAISLYKEKWGWDATIYPEGHMAIFNIPVTEYTDEDSPGESEQHVQNTITGAWTRFKDVLSFCWQNFDGDIFFGSSGGKIYEFDSGEDDAGDAIESTFQTAWLPIGGLGANKLFKALREAYRVNASINVDNTFAVDFQEFASQTFPASIDSSAAEWDVALWDVSLWTSADRIVHEWHTIGTYGERISMRKRMSTKQKVTYLGMSWLYEIARRL